MAAELWLNLGGKDYRLVGKTIRLGRADDNDIVLNDKSISRYHAIITIIHDQIILEDLKSRNGTRVNSNPVRRAELRDGDDVMLGELSGLFFLRFKTTGAGGAAGLAKDELKKIGVEVSKVFQGADDLRKKFNKLKINKKLFLGLGGFLFILVLMKMFSASETTLSVQEAEAVAAPQPVVVGSVDKHEFERCLQFEDLGSFRQAAACLKQLKHTQEVKRALDRIQERQSELSQRRFEEGERAFQNYYYDVAIQKWQEVLLIADDDSKFWREAAQKIDEAEKKRRGE